MLDRIAVDSLLSNKGAGALLGVENAADFHFAIGTHHGVGIDLEIDGNLSDRGELIARDQEARGNGGLDLVDELAVEGNATLHIEAESKGSPDWNRNLHADKCCTSVLVHVKKKIPERERVGFPLGLGRGEGALERASFRSGPVRGKPHGKPGQAGQAGQAWGTLLGLPVQGLRGCDSAVPSRVAKRAMFSQANQSPQRE